mmetsp:Transcript_1495/g.4039  ORF Transcript_1495/g.4039 Transcript_1495/m.4039 type:complete len:158 (+) Transcript_1495:355-828(+)
MPNFWESIGLPWCVCDDERKPHMARRKLRQVSSRKLDVKQATSTVQAINPNESNIPDSARTKSILKEPPIAPAPARIASWQRNPEPPEGWTAEQQDVLLELYRKFPKEKGRNKDDAEHWRRMRILAKNIPGKTPEECELCVQNFESNKVAFFGSKFQ